MNSRKYYITRNAWYGLKTLKVCDNLAHAKRWIAKHFDGGHYSVYNSNIVLFSI